MKHLIWLIVRELHLALGVALLLFLLLEWWSPRLVLAYVNYNLVFIFWLISAIMLLVLNKYQSSQSGD
jgi:hypothetical protein